MYVPAYTTRGKVAMSTEYNSLLDFLNKTDSIQDAIEKLERFANNVKCRTCRYCFYHEDAIPGWCEPEFTFHTNTQGENRLVGQCRRGAPREEIDSNNQTRTLAYVTVPLDDWWCGEWKPRI